MRLLEVGIQNFKSLKSVTLKPGPLSVFIGPNGAGKSNLCEALAFIDDMDQLGLENAVARRGGYENICYRHSRRSTAPIVIHTIVSSLGTEIRLPPPSDERDRRLDALITERSISFRASGQGFKAPFSIAAESLKMVVQLSDPRETEVILSARRRGDTIENLHVNGPFQVEASEGKSTDRALRALLSDSLESTESFERLLPHYVLGRPSRRAAQLSIGLYQVQPLSGRFSGVPTPNPELDRDGSNMPAVIDRLKAREPQAFLAILDTLRTIMPTLVDIEVFQTPQKLLGLAFREEGFRQPWLVEHVSDGTIRALGLLTALFSASADVVVIEEPENSLHPWAIGQFIKACREASKTKQIMLTTHSPIVIDQLQPEELWVVSKRAGATNIDRLDDIDADARIGWEGGEFSLSEYLRSGIVAEAVPAFDA